MWRLITVHLILLGLDPIAAEWCYTDPACGPSTWVTQGFCNGSRQSPINIVDASVQYNASLGTFTFTNYGDSSKLVLLNNPGHTVEVQLASGVTLSGGGLPSTYSAVAFHFHWGNTSQNGSEHQLGGRQFPMEMHIVHTKNGMNLTAAKQDPNGIAVLGFFIDVGTSSSKLPTLASLLVNVSNAGTNITLNGSFSIDSILGAVDRTSYYRYLGSLTTPTCDEAVVWTVFRNPILVPASVIQNFSSNIYLNSTGSPQNMVNNFRILQQLNSRVVQSSTNVNSAGNSATSLAGGIFSANLLFGFLLSLVNALVLMS
ncbi:hypothetical protein XENTR_v10023732 [Xenopus tropicalis]|uniref:Carbonic anhydrase n=1 Tax=Xenopus tropicalis TaxID=8364 RepID=A0A6I8SZM6_XENTR|nr:carbonic anhydrase 4-like [Xenopus tropicalis]KAE8578697.1 hypothetical protein XENTR_v10023732 [Xenopus tropicalis]KAE8578698.1 hypothetical protein XENTR_v10023732 [Xenopus tropicalis]